MLLSSSDTKTLIHLFLFTNSAQRELVSICTHYTENTQQRLTFLALLPWIQPAYKNCLTFLIQGRLRSVATPWALVLPL